MRRCYALWLLACLLLACGMLPGQSGSPKFDAFYAKFQAAVAQKDQATLTRMMASQFDYFQAQGVAPAQVFQSLNADDGAQWNNLQQAVGAQPTVLDGGYNGRPARALPCTATQITYQCLVIFQQDSQNRWRWKGMVMMQQ